MHGTLSTLCTAAAEILLPRGAAVLLITLHVSGLLCHEPYGETNESVHHQLHLDFNLVKS